MAAPKEFKNRKAFFQYHVLETVEAGMALIGSEVKSIRDGKLNLSDSYAQINGGQVFLVNCHISEYKNAPTFGHQPLRKRKLLLHRAEIRKLQKKVDERGCTLIPLKVFFNARGYAKVQLGVCKGKQTHDKRQAVKERELDREIRREISRH